MNKVARKFIPLISIILVLIMGLSTTIKNYTYKKVEVKTQDYLIDVHASSLSNLKSCSNGYENPGRTIYITNYTRYILNSDYYAEENLPKCSMVKVYCYVKYGGKYYGRISSSSSPAKYFNLSIGGYETWAPNTCINNTKTTSTDTISGKVGKVTITPEVGLDKLYRDRTGSVSVKVTDLKNVNSESDLVAKVTAQNGRDMTKYFNITSELSRDKKTMSYKINMKNGINYYEGAWVIRFIPRDNRVNFETRTFYTVGYYYNYTAQLEQISEYEDNPYNLENEWHVNISNKIGIDENLEYLNVSVYGRNPWGNQNEWTDYTWAFNIEKNPQGSYVSIKNKNWAYITEYEVRLTYQNSSRSTARGQLARTTEKFKLGKKFLDFHSIRTPAVVSYRYGLKTVDHPHDVLVTKIDPANDKIYVTESYNDINYGDHVTNDYVYTQAEYEEKYSVFLSDIPYMPDGNIYIKYNDDYKFFRFNEYSYGTYYDYYDADGLYNKPTGANYLFGEQEFWDKGMHDIYNTLRNGTDTIKVISAPENDHQTNTYAYKFTYTVPTIKFTPQKNRALTPLTQNGGEYNYKYTYLNSVDVNDFRNSKVSFYKEDGTKVEDDIFRLTWGKNEWVDNRNVLDFKISYFDPKLPDDRNGAYYAYIEVENATPIKVYFTIEIGETDFYLQSSFDKHTGINDIQTQYPPGNMDYEWYIGFFLVRGGSVVTEKTAQTLNATIYDRQVEFAEGYSSTEPEGTVHTLRFFDTVNYNVEILSYDGTNVKYKVTETPDNGLDEVTMYNGTYTKTLAQVETLYPNVAELIKKGIIKFNADGTIDKTTNGFPLTIDFYGEVDDATSSTGKKTIITYTKDGVQTTLPIIDTLNHNDFANIETEVYKYVATCLAFDADGHLINGTVVGQRKEYVDKQGNEIVGQNVTNRFKITIDLDNPENIERAITILPNPQVEKGKYYVYVDYDSSIGVGYLNNDPDPVISYINYPEMYNRNIHETSIEYVGPQYTPSFKDTILYNDGNDKEKMYYNEKSVAVIPFDTGYINYLDGHTTIKYYYLAPSKELKTEADVLAAEWTEIDDPNKYFDVRNTINDTTKDNIEKTGSGDMIIQITNRPEATENKLDTPRGYYKVVLTYDYDGGTARIEKVISNISKYYGMNFDDEQDITYIRNLSEKKTITGTLAYVEHPENIVKTIKVLDNANSEHYLVFDENTKTVYDENNPSKVIFRYNFTTTAISNTESSFKLELTNIQDAAYIGKYTLKLSYTEEEEYVLVGEGLYTSSEATSEFQFDVDKDNFRFTLESLDPVLTRDEQYLEAVIKTEYIPYDTLESFSFEIRQFNAQSGEYDIVVSDTGTNEHFTFEKHENTNEIWTQESETVNRGKIKIHMSKDVELNSSYQLVINYASVLEEAYFINDLARMFEWNLGENGIVGIYKENVINNGVQEVEETIVNEFYKNILGTEIYGAVIGPHKDDANLLFTNECSTGVCDPTNLDTTLNDLFVINNTTGTDGNFKLKYKEDLQEKDLLPAGEYQLIVYYSATDYKIIPITVNPRYINLAFKTIRTYTTISNEKTVDGLFSNKPGEIYFETKIQGVDYDEVNVYVRSATNNTNLINYFTYTSDDWNNYLVNHNLTMKYSATKAIPSGDYMVVLEYNDGEEIKVATHEFRIGRTYFDYEIENVIYTPDPIYANVKDGGKITLEFSTDSIQNISTGIDGTQATATRHIFAENTIIRNSNDVDVTKNFNIEAVTSNRGPNAFDLILEFAENGVAPGEYMFETYYTIDDTTVRKEQLLTIGDYAKDLEITSVDIESPAADGLVHNNLIGTYIINYQTKYEIDLSYININVFDKEGNDVSDYFNIISSEKNIKVIYNPVDPILEPGKYTIKVQYVENTIIPTSNEVEVDMYKSLKEFKIYDLDTTSSRIYADRTNQKYTFRIEDKLFTTEQKQLLKARIYDAENNIVYSDYTEDNVENKFDVNNITSATSNFFEIGIIAFKAPVGTYKIQLTYEEGDRINYVSNYLPFTIDDTFHNVTIDEIDSYIVPVKDYNNDNVIYDKDGAIGYFKYQTSYIPKSEDEISVRIYKGLTLVKDTNADFGTVTDEFGFEDLTASFETGELEPGSYKAVICINGLPYTGLDFEVEHYEPLTKLTVTMAGKLLTEETIINVNDSNILYVALYPTNATSKNFKVEIEDPSVVKYENGRLTGLKHGETTLKVVTSDITFTTRITVKQLLSSTKYVISHGTPGYVLINSVNFESITLQNAFQNLTALKTGYKVYDIDGTTEITDMTTNFTTGMKLVNGDGMAYILVLKGDTNQDGEINLGDVAVLFQYVTNSNPPEKTEEILKAYDVVESGEVDLGSVAKLFQFVTGYRSSI